MPSPLISACAVGAVGRRLWAGVCAWQHMTEPASATARPSHAHSTVSFRVPPVRVIEDRRTPPDAGQKRCVRADYRCQNRMKLVLFDIDGTLVLTGGAGLRAMNRAVRRARRARRCARRHSGRRPHRLDHPARTRSRASAATLDDELLRCCASRYLTHLREEILMPGHADGRIWAARRHQGVMPGIRELLDALQRATMSSRTADGQLRGGARIKLEHFDLWRYFRCGAYGDDAADRNALVPFALERARGLRLPDDRRRANPRDRRHAARRRLRASGRRGSGRRRDRQVHRRASCGPAARKSCSRISATSEAFLKLLALSDQRALRYDVPNGSERGPVALPVFKTGRCPRFAGGLGSTPRRFRHSLA